MLEYGAHPGDNNQPIFSPNSLSLLLPGSFPAVSSEIPSRGCFQPGARCCSPTQECDPAPTLYLQAGVLPGGRKHSWEFTGQAWLTCFLPAPQMPGLCLQSPPKLGAKPCISSWCSLGKNKSSSPQSGPVPTGFDPSDIPNRIRPLWLFTPCFPSCQGRGGRWGRAASFAGCGDAGTDGALLGEPLPHWQCCRRTLCHPLPPIQRSSQGKCCTQGSWFLPQ